MAELEAVARVPSASDRDRAGSLALAANIRMFLGDPEGARAQTQRAEAVGSDDNVTTCLTLQTVAPAASATGAGCTASPVVRVAAAGLTNRQIGINTRIVPPWTAINPYRGSGAGPDSDKSA